MLTLPRNCQTVKPQKFQGGFKNLQNRSRRRQSAHFSSIIGVLAPTAVGGYDFLKPPCRNSRMQKLLPDELPGVSCQCHEQAKP